MDNAQKPSPEADPAQDRRRFLRTLACGSVALTLGGGTVAAFIFRRNGVISDPWRETVEETIDRHYGVLSRDLKLIWITTDKELDMAFKIFSRDLNTAGGQFSDEKITHRGMAGLIVDMACDMVDSGNRAETWFEQNLSPYLQPAFSQYAGNLARIEKTFGERFARAIADFNERVVTDLLRDLPSHAYAPKPATIEESVNLAFARQGIRFGGGAGLGIGLAMVGTGVHFYQQLLLTLVRRLRLALIRLFAPVARRLTMRMGASLLTAKVPPLALLVAVAGAGLTAYEIAALRNHARLDFEQALAEGIGDMHKELNTRVKWPLMENLAAYEQNQNVIKNDIVTSVGSHRFIIAPTPKSYRPQARGRNGIR